MAIPRRRAADVSDGPSLETYIETRFNLLTESQKEQAAAQHAALTAVVEQSKVAREAIKAAIDASQVAADLRYQQRFEAQSDALAAAFLSQQTAMQTALKTAQEAVQAALAAADRAVAKAEAAADKRFEALNELRQMLNDMVTTLFPRTEAAQQFKAVTEKIDATNKRVELVEGRLNTAAGEVRGGQRTKDDTRTYITVGISILVFLILLATFILARVR